MKAHRTDVLSLTFAVIFLAVVGAWVAAQVGDLDPPALGWFVAGGLIFFGLLGLVGALRTAHAEPPATPEPPPSPATLEPLAPIALEPLAPVAPEPPGQVEPSAPQPEPAVPANGGADDLDGRR